MKAAELSREFWVWVAFLLIVTLLQTELLWDALHGLFKVSWRPERVWARAAAIPAIVMAARLAIALKMPWWKVVVVTVCAPIAGANLLSLIWIERAIKTAKA
jgi:hypothetical protein